MHGKQKGFTLIEILVVVTIIGVLAGLVVVLIPKGQFEAQKVECQSNAKNIVGFFTMASKYPRQSGVNLILYLVKRKDIEGEDSIKTLFCPGDQAESLEQAGGLDAYKDIDLTRVGEYGHLSSYAGRDQSNKVCAASKGSSKQVVMVSDDSEDHHDGKGFVVGLSGGSAKWRHKFDDWGVDIDKKVDVGEGSEIEELQCLKAD